MQIVVYQYDNKAFWANYVYSSKEFPANRIEWYPSNFSFESSRDVRIKSTEFLGRIRKVIPIIL